MIMESIFIMLFLLILNLYVYFGISYKNQIKFPLNLLITSFSFIIGVLLLPVNIPSTPFIQIFFIMFQVVVFFFNAIEYYLIKKGGK